MVDLKDFFNKEYVYAVVGASNNEDKYGFKILKSLIDAGYDAIPINPKEKVIYGQKCYQNLSQVKEKIDVVDFVVPKNITGLMLKEVSKLKIKKVWFQPNTFDDELIKYCKENKIKYIKDFCLLKSVLESD